MALGDEQFKSILENIKKQNNLEDETRFQAALKQEGMTMADLRRNLERQMFVSQVQRRDVARQDQRDRRGGQGLLRGRTRANSPRRRRSRSARS